MPVVRGGYVVTSRAPLHPLQVACEFPAPPADRNSNFVLAPHAIEVHRIDVRRFDVRGAGATFLWPTGSCVTDAPLAGRLAAPGKLN